MMPYMIHAMKAYMIHAMKAYMIHEGCDRFGI
jgi:hypothetical protein